MSSWSGLASLCSSARFSSAHHAAVPSTLPEVALNSNWVYWGERAFPLLIVSLLALTAVYNGLVLGKLPTKFGREGVEYPAEAADAMSKVVSQLQDFLEKQREVPKAESIADVAVIESAVERL